MIDQLFGSTYIQSAIDLSVLAGRQFDDTKGLPNKQEGLRLLTAACADIRLGIQELEALPADHNLAKRVPVLLDESRRRLSEWEGSINQLKPIKVANGR